MKYLVLDTNIIINFPEILSYKRKDLKVIVPDIVIQQLLNYRSPRRQELISLIQRAQDEEIISISSIELPKERINGSNRIDLLDYNIYRYAKMLQTNGSEVILATDDKNLSDFANANGINTYSSSSLMNFYSTNTIKNETIEIKAKEIEHKEGWSILANIIIAIALIVALILFTRYFGDIVDKLTNIFLIIFLIVVGFWLFEVREKKKQLYGFVEIGVGILTLVIVFYPDLVLSNWDFYLKIVAGLYVIVRGIDNLYKGSEDKRLGPLLKRIFKFK